MPRWDFLPVYASLQHKHVSKVRLMQGHLLRGPMRSRHSNTLVENFSSDGALTDQARHNSTHHFGKIVTYANGYAKYLAGLFRSHCSSNSLSI